MTDLEPPQAALQRARDYVEWHDCPHASDEEPPPFDEDDVRALIAALARPAPVAVPSREREAILAAMVDAARARGGAGAQFIADGNTNLWLDIAFDAILALCRGEGGGRK